ncbi:peptide deformylase [uncultured Photobacterium sp.]|uniref:peptide deformylase n=1 Tax=uncultured Photobacterium sp. TaxID=173973 RepID=UPI00260D493C|nr:peptide deformylase [uncultured Photobacterium sp.]
MAVLDILTIPNPKLKVQTTEVKDISTVQSLIEDMLDTMYHTDNGIGLAAPQVGRSEAIIVIDISPERNDPLILVNPKIISGENPVLGQEGCLSVPGYYADVERFEKVKVSAWDREGNSIEIERDDFLAIAMQHEIDHLKGKLFIDYLSPLKKQMALKKVKKHVKSAV